MAIALLQSTTTYPYSATTITCTAGSLVVLFGSTNVNYTGIDIAVSDNNSGVWTVKPGYGDSVGSFVSGWIAYAWNHPSGSTQITVSGAPWISDTGISIHEYSGIQTSSDPFDGINGAFSSLANPSSGNITTTGSNDLLVAFLADENNTASPTSYDIFTNVQESTGHYHTTAHDLNVGINTYGFNPTRVAGTDAVVMIAAFKGAGGLTQDQEWPGISQIAASGGMIGLQWK